MVYKATIIGEDKAGKIMGVEQKAEVRRKESMEGKIQCLKVGMIGGLVRTEEDIEAERIWPRLLSKVSSRAKQH